MKCPFCNSILSKVIDKRAVESRSEIRRRRECLKCSKRFTTYEGLAEFQLMVIKRSGKREVYDREKLTTGLTRALQKRPAIDQVEVIISKIEGKIREKGLKEIPSSFLGKALLSELKKLDPIAYLRFASVYRHFADAGDFEKELKGFGKID